MKGFDKIFIKNALKGHSKMAFNPRHLTTMNFGEMIPVWHMECVPGDKIKVSHNVFSRVAPLVVPSYVSSNVRTASFFVPYHQVVDGWDSWVNGEQKYLGVTVYPRYFLMSDLWDVFFTNFDSMSTASANDYDVKYINASGTTVYKFLTKHGRYLYKVLRSLGYQCPPNVDERTNSVWYSKTSSIKLNALPLLCYAKAYNDWMSNAARFNSSALTTLLYNIKRDITYQSYYNSGGRLQSFGIKYILEHIFINYEDDYFTTAWETPNRLIHDNGVAPVSIKVSYDGSSSTSNTIYGNFEDTFLQQGKPSNTTITQRALNYMRDFDAYVRRNNLAGSKDVEQIYARFGIKVDDYKVRFAYPLGSSSCPLQIGDVTATANSTFSGEQMPIGDFVGKGIVQGNGNSFNFESSDYGMALTMLYLTVKPIYADGFDRAVLKSEPMEYFQPEFDGEQAQAVAKMEVASKVFTNDEDVNGVFGFTPLYQDYRFQRDRITGDFALRALYQPWHFNRDLVGVVTAGGLKAQLPDLLQMRQYADEYNRIFTEDTGYEDKFIMDIKTDVSAVRPMKSISGSYDLGVGDTEISNNGTTVK